MRTSSMTMKGLARLAGVSQPTVSDILNDRWRQKRISTGLADRVRKLAEQHHYRPNRLVRAIRTGRTNTLSLILPSISGRYFPLIAEGVEEEAKRHGYHLLISRVLRGLEDEVAEIEMLLEQRVDGLIVLPRYGQNNRDNYRRLIGEGVPLVSVDEYLPDVPCPAVVGEDERGAYLAADHLIRLGHRRLAYLSGEDSDVTHLQDRRRGFERAVADHVGSGVTASSIRADRQAIEEALTAPQRPTAVVASNDYDALKGMAAAFGLGLRVPADMAFVGFSDCLENVSFLRVPLTSVRVDAQDMGRRAMRALLREIGQPGGRHTVERVPAELVVRESCGGGGRASGAVAPGE